MSNDETVNRATQDLDHVRRRNESPEYIERDVHFIIHDKLPPRVLVISCCQLPQGQKGRVTEEPRGPVPLCRR